MGGRRDEIREVRRWVGKEESMGMRRGTLVKGVTRASEGDVCWGER